MDLWATLYESYREIMMWLVKEILGKMLKFYIYIQYVASEWSLLVLL